MYFLFCYIISMKAIHIEITYLAILHYNKGKNAKSICETFKISRSSLSRFTQRYNTTGNLDPIPKTQPKKFSEHLLSI